MEEEDFSDIKFVDVSQMPLEEWLQLVWDEPPDKHFTNVAFPTDSHRQEYIETISKRSDEEVSRLLYHFLIRTGSMGLYDKIHYESLMPIKESDPELYEWMMSKQYYRRLLLNSVGLDKIPPWEGITWILDLLPHHPKIAIEGIHAYALAHNQVLPDWRWHGLYDAIAVIRAKFIGTPDTNSEAIQILLNLSSRDFEHLIGLLYRYMEYETELTSPQKDGGRDIIAKRLTTGKTEYLLIECKRYGGSVGVKIVRALLGVVSDEKVNKGVLVTTSRFTKEAQKFAKRNSRLELIDGNQLILLMNEYLGSKWSLYIERLIDINRQGLLNNALSLGDAAPNNSFNASDN